MALIRRIFLCWLLDRHTPWRVVSYRLWDTDFDIPVGIICDRCGKSVC